MSKLKKYWLTGSALALVATSAYGRTFAIAPGDLDLALSLYQTQSGRVLAVADDSMRGIRTGGARGELSDDQALTRLLKGTGFTYARDQSGVIVIVPQERTHMRPDQAAPIHVAAASSAAVETVVVTSSKIKGDIQTVPIAITALSQEQLTSRQIAGGPDLVKEVPNLTFTKTNFTGYSIQIRGIGTQAISVTTDPAVAVAFNDIPFIRNHFFEQEFYDVNQVEVLRGPQGTLYGRNATAGVVNVVSAKPTDQFEAMLSADWGNYTNRRYEGMVNLPIVGDKLALRIAGEWTKRDGYSFNTLTNQPTDGRDLWSARTSLRWQPSSALDVNLVWEHFQENDDRLRSGKQLCKTALPPTSVDGVPIGAGGDTFDQADFLSQGCEMTSLYAPSAFEVPYGPSLPYYSGLTAAGAPILSGFDVYASTTQSKNLRNIETQIAPHYRAKNDTLTLSMDYNITPALTLSSDTGYNNDFLWSSEDYNRFNTQPGVFVYGPGLGGEEFSAIQPDPLAGQNGVPAYSGVFCDPQLGCSDRLLAEDLSDEKSWQLSQEFRAASHFDGPLNFSVGGNYLHYETNEDYYVFINTLTMFSLQNKIPGTYVPGVSDNSQFLNGYRYPNPIMPVDIFTHGHYIDPNPITNLNGQGHNYFRSQNPYVLNSYAAFGEVYYNLTNDVKLTGGLRWTNDQKHFIDIPSEVLIADYGYPATGVVNQQWSQWTGRGVATWTPKLSFTDQSMFYASYAHGYKAGGANPPGALFPETEEVSQSDLLTTNPIHPLIFKPEFVDAYELGTKNTLLDGGLTLDGDIFFYNYKGYQISRIVDRTAINDNFDAKVKGAELEASYEPIPGLKFHFAGGYESTRIDNGQSSVDLMDRTAGNPNWMVVRPFVTESSNCILPTYVVAAGAGDTACDLAYGGHLDPITGQPYSPSTDIVINGFHYYGFDPLSTDPNAPADVNNGLGLPPNKGQGFSKNVGGHQLPNAPHFTTSLSADYTMPVSADWAATLHSDFYWQSQSWARVFNDRPYDKLRGYSNVNLALILTDAGGWQVMGYVKNIFDATAITGDFLNSDDTGLTTNVFLTDPRLFGVRVTKNFDGGDSGAGDFFTGLTTTGNGRPLFWIELGGGLERVDQPQQPFAPAFVSAFDAAGMRKTIDVQSPPTLALEEDAKISYQPPESDWLLSASIRYGRSGSNRQRHQQTANEIIPVHFTFKYHDFSKYDYPTAHAKFADGQSHFSENHTIIDFQAGKDVGLGMFGTRGSSVVSAGIRIAQLRSRSSVDLRGEPDVHYTPSAQITSLASWLAFRNQDVRFHDYHGSAILERDFHGVGPKLSWDASTPLLGDAEEGEVAIDWDVNGAVLFGHQAVKGHHQTTTKTYNLNHYYSNFKHGGIKQINFGDGYSGCGHALNENVCPPSNTVVSEPPDINRSRSVTVPDLGASIGVSYRYRSAKINFGYRIDDFLGAMDGGIDTRKSENRAFYGPYASISIGFGQ